jgi:outer membrane receptor protein involved in Fe transport
VLIFSSALFLSSLLCAQSAVDGTNDDVVTLDEFTVTSATDDSYLATQSTSGTRLSSEIINLPFSVSVLTEDFIADFSIFDLDEQAVFVSGMAGGDPAQGGGGGTRLRGFMVPYFRNGFYRTAAPDSNSIARVEVVKGPQSAVYGRVAPGGVINYISKKPSTKFKAGASYMFGSYANERAEAYVTGPLVPGKLYMRIDAAAYHLERTTDFWYNDTTNISGGLTYKINEKTSLSLEHEYTKRVMQGGQAFIRWQSTEDVTVVGAGGVAQIKPITTVRGSVYDMTDRAVAERLTRFAPHGADQQIDRISNSSYLTFERKFTPTLSLRANLGYSSRLYKKDRGTSTPTNWSTTPTTALQNILNTLNGIWLDTTKGIWTAGRAGAYQTIDYEEKGAQVDLTKQWRTSIKQRTLFTFDIFEQDHDQKTWALSGAALDTALTTLGFDTVGKRNAWKYPDLFNPGVSGYYPNPAFDPNTWSATESGTYLLNRFYYGGLLNHTVELFDGRLALIGSVRQDWAEYEYQRPLQTAPNSKLKDAKDKTDRFTYSVGANYHIVPRKVVGYVNVATGFDPSPQADPNTGEIHGNRDSTGYEAGFKGLLLNDTISYTTALFQVKQTNEVTDNPDNPSGSDPALSRYIAGGNTRARGLSLDVSGKVSRNLTLLGNIAWTEVRIVKNVANPALVGTRPMGGQNVPPRSYALAARYNFRDGFLKGTALGLSYQNIQQFMRTAPVYGTDIIYGTTERVKTSEAYFIPERREVAGFISHSWKLRGKATLTMKLNLINIFDRETMTVAGYAPLGREARFTTSLKF